MNKEFKTVKEFENYLLENSLKIESQRGGFIGLNMESINYFTVVDKNGIRQQVKVKQKIV